MDFFTEGLAQHWGSREMIKANRQAEAEEMRRMQEQMEEYRSILDDIKVMSERNAELAERMLKIADSMTLAVDSAHTDSAPAVDTEEMKAVIESSLGSMSEQMRAAGDEMARRFAEAEESNHRENVKVFRNVQAVVVDELKVQTGELEASNATMRKSLKKCKGLMVATLVISCISLAYNVVASIGLIDSLVDWVEGLF